MKNLEVIGVNSEEIVFENGIKLFSEHRQDCCESHYLSFENLTIDDFHGLKFDLTDDKFFKRIDGYGIELRPIAGRSIVLPGYGYNNGYYSSELTLTLSDGKTLYKNFDISECQEIKGYE